MKKFSKCGRETLGWSPSSSQEICNRNYFHNNTKVSFAFSLYSLMSVAFSRGYMTCDNVIALMANGMCAYIFYVLKVLGFNFKYGKNKQIQPI